jgi:hypothetical protein
MEMANQPTAITPHSTANVVLPLLARMITMPRARQDIRRNARHTHGDLTDRESCTE